MLTGFTAALLLITLCELGDKSFFVALVLATRHSRAWVFGGTLAALALMTLLSVALGQMLTILPERLVQGLGTVLLLGFGLRLVIQAWHTCPEARCGGEHEAQSALTQAPAGRFSLLQTWGQRCPQVLVGGQAFLLAFLSEWGDRTQISTITLGATYSPGAVTLGAIAGHAVSTGLAVLGGRLLAGRLRERTLLGLGGGLFLLFGGLTLVAPS
ncbi:MAG: TMEM165/GDT1 family protein [Gloeomargaritaceae cyanobacterium C42_A2020_066]|nr:TMEM165/GDT1 family protein [Gloeomargaritaceae cyanobacterium C42_A2020_066]